MNLIASVLFRISLKDDKLFTQILTITRALFLAFFNIKCYTADTFFKSAHRLLTYTEYSDMKDYWDTHSKAFTLYQKQEISKTKINSKVNFGEYDKRSIKWIVLEKNRTLLICNNILDFAAYNKTEKMLAIGETAPLENG